MGKYSREDRVESLAIKTFLIIILILIFNQ
jgi:hypothetical protein